MICGRLARLTAARAPPIRASTPARATGSAQAAAARHRDGRAVDLARAARRDAAVPGVEHDEHAARARAPRRARRRSPRRAAPAAAAATPGSRRRAAGVPSPTMRVAGHVGDVRDAGERQQVVLADRAELDVAQQHELAELARRRVELGRVARGARAGPRRGRRRSRRRPPRPAAGSSASPGRAGSSPIAARSSATAASMRPESIAIGVLGGRDAGGLARARGALRLRRRLGVDAAVDELRRRSAPSPRSRSAGGR